MPAKNRKEQNRTYYIKHRDDPEYRAKVQTTTKAWYRRVKAEVAAMREQRDQEGQTS